MNLTIKTKLLTSPEQFQSLKSTMRDFSDACNYISKESFESRIFNQFKLHRLIYYKARKEFPSLSSEFIIRAIAKVSNSYKTNRDVIHKFGKYSAVIYDQRLLSYTEPSTASINSVNGRLKIPFVVGQHKNIKNYYVKGRAHLVFDSNKFFLNIVIEINDGIPFKPKGIIGVDKGIVNIATTSDGIIFSGKEIENNRKRFVNIRTSLQKKGSKSAKRHLKKISKRQSRFQKDFNHQISKQIVSIAKGTERAIALEDLKGIRSRQKVRKANRHRFGSWAFYQLDNFIEYKSKIAGVTVKKVDPRNTSRTCSVCGFISKSNRKSQSIFSCKSCGTKLNADLNAAINIAAKATVNLPIAVVV